MIRSMPIRRLVTKEGGRAVLSDFVSATIVVDGLVEIPIAVPIRALDHILVTTSKLSKEQRERITTHVLVERNVFNRLLKRNLGRAQVEPCVFPSLSEALDHLRSLARSKGWDSARMARIECEGESDQESRLERYREALLIPKGFVQWTEVPD